MFCAIGLYQEDFLLIKSNGTKHVEEVMSLQKLEVALWPYLNGCDFSLVYVSILENIGLYLKILHYWKIFFFFFMWWIGDSGEGNEKEKHGDWVHS